MLSAAIECGGETHDVFVRNLSVAGALVEGRNLPGQGQSVVFHRADYRVPATVMWRAEGKCGLSFAHLVNVEDMIRRKGPPAHQSRVDSIQRALREQRAVPTFVETEALVGAAAIGTRLVDQLGYALRLAETANETLANDAHILAEHGVSLQQLDEIEQLLRKLVAQVSAEGAHGRC